MKTASLRITGRTRELIFLTAIFLHWFGQFTYTPFFSPYLEQLAIPASMIGLIVGGYGFSQMVFRVPLGITSDIFRLHSLYMTSGMLCLVLSGLLLYFAQSAALFLLGRIIGGVASATWVCFIVFYPSIASPKLAGRTTSRLVAINSAGTLVATALGGLLYDLLGIRAMFLLSSAAGALSFLLMLLVRPDPDTPAPTPVHFRDTLSVLKDKNLINCALLCAMQQTISYATSMSFLQNYAVTLGATSTQLALLSTLLMGMLTVGSFLLSSKLRAGIPDRVFVVLGFVFAVIYCLMFSLARSVTVLLIAQVIAGFSKAFITSSLMGYCTKKIRPELRSSALGIYQSIYGLGMTFGSPIMGVILDATGNNYVLGFYIIAGLSALSVVWSLFTFCRKKGISWCD